MLAVRQKEHNIDIRIFLRVNKLLKTLDSCLGSPVDVIRKFINHSWRFMDAYQIPLSGKAVAWAVHKQNGHHTVSRTAMMHLDAVLNPN